MYRKQPVDYAQQLNEGFAGGITMGLLSWFSFVDEGWPAPGSIYAIGLGDYWTTGWPQWREWKPLAKYFARSNMVLEKGKAWVDAAIYLDKGLATVHELETPKFSSNTLVAAVDTYDFINSVSLKSRSRANHGKALWKGPFLSGTYH